MPRHSVRTSDGAFLVIDDDLHAVVAHDFANLLGAATGLRNAGRPPFGLLPSGHIDDRKAPNGDLLLGR